MNDLSSGMPWPRACVGGLRSRASRGLVVAALLALSLSAPSGRAQAAKPTQRFFVMGNGFLEIASVKNEHRFRGRYRTRKGRYVKRALLQINRVFGVPDDEQVNRVSLRLIEALSLLRRRLRGGAVIVSSGYRSPAYNEGLRAKGRTVAKASLHQYAMAADLRIEGVSTKRAWKLARKLRLGGAGYYNSPWMHLDSGPKRHWTQSTANVRKGVSLQNKRITLVPQYDRYAAGERMTLRFTRMTAFPIGVKPRFQLQRKDGDTWVPVHRNRATFHRSKTRGPCRQLNSVTEMADIRWPLPADLKPGRYRLRAAFCKSRWKEMPRATSSYPFDITP